ncbi:phospholipase D family protein [Hansschlegelia quercus]|uniref:Phospholipase D-like domain-containing protein n=1 Tax=Hansschlegelia quercus TaxID=2528245 RepID=A0A4Q9GMR2_9HYPH|nr:phospholipase D family protein [Hansschlegelia quercus]TBN54445.1 hypothetical protein EYR15_06340 [Hansschlegelia quercus]
MTSYLDALRPEQGWTADLAIIAAYSADPISIVAALLAMVGRDDEDRPAARRDLADAIEAARDRFRVVIQRGRLAKMARTPRLTGVLDQFVRDVAFDERRQSWHPKAALVKVSTDKAIEWRLWIGSRNLTAQENRDLGLVLVARPGGQGRRVPGVDDIATALAERAGLPGVSARGLAAEIAALKWKAPAGVRVDRLGISTGKGDWSLPALPKAVDALTVVSPFLDAGFLRHVAKTECRGGERQLLSTRFEIERLGATCRPFGDSLALDAPDYPPTNFEAPDPVDPTPASAVEEGEELGRGLHAKLLHIRQGDKRRLWTGSANATQRAWTGRNVEIIAELSVDEAVEGGLMSLIAEARPIRWEDAAVLKDVEAEKDELERARAEVSARWKGEIVWDTESIRLRHSSILHPSDARIRLEAGLITSDLKTWPAGQTELDLGPIQTADLTELVQLRLMLGDASCEWIVQAPATPPFGVERDRAAFMRAMGAREFLLWIADTMRGAAASPNDPDWTKDEPSRSSTGEPTPTWTADLPTQEEIFSTWSRSPAVYKAVQYRISAYLPALLEHTRTADPNGHTQLKQFAQMWAVCEEGLGAPS